MTSLSLSSSSGSVYQESYLQVGETLVKTIENYKPIRLSSYLSPSTSDEGLEETSILALSISSENSTEKKTFTQSNWADTSKWDPEGQRLQDSSAARNILLLGRNSILTSTKEDALSIAAEKGICAIITDLLEDDVLETRWYYRMNLYFVGTSMIQAAKHGHLEAVKQLVNYILQKPHNEPYYKLFNLLVHRALKEKPSPEIVSILTSWEGYQPLNDCKPAPPPPPPEPKEKSYLPWWLLGY